MVESGVRNAERRAVIEATPSVRPLERDELLTGLTRQFGIILIAENQSILRIGIAEVNLLSALYWLNRSALSVQVEVGRKRISFNSDDFKSRVLNAREVIVNYTKIDGLTDKIIIEPYFWQEFGNKWVSPNTNNTEARAVYSDRLTFPGLIRMIDILGAPSFDQMWRAREIDIVYTWVNHSDPDWATQYKIYKAGINNDYRGLEMPIPKSDDSTSVTRFHSNDELRYSMRSIATNLPWVRNIYIFTNCSPPDWLNTEHPRVRWVRHEEVIPEQYLPTFSSHVIESYLHKIPGLSNHFIYMNDDFFINKPVDKSFFFTESGISRAFLEPYGMVVGPVIEGAADYLNAGRNSAALISEAFGFVPTRLHRHSPYALRRDLLDEIEERWPSKLGAMRHNRFRTAHDLNIPSFLYHHYGLATGRVTLSSTKSVLVKSQDIRWRLQLLRIMHENPSTFCINEGGATPAGRDWHRRTRFFLESMWSSPAPWEGTT